MPTTTAGALADLTLTEVVILDGATVTTAELNILDGVTATATELNYVDGVTSAIQTQIDTKAALAGPTFTGTPAAPRYGHSAILAGSRIIIFGGKGEKGKVFRDLHALDPVTMTWY